MDITYLEVCVQFQLWSIYRFASLKLSTSTIVVPRRHYSICAPTHAAFPLKKVHYHGHNSSTVFLRHKGSCPVGVMTYHRLSTVTLLTQNLKRTVVVASTMSLFNLLNVRVCHATSAASPSRKVFRCIRPRPYSAYSSLLAFCHLSSSYVSLPLQPPTSIVFCRLPAAHRGVHLEVRGAAAVRVRPVGDIFAVRRANLGTMEKI